MNTTILNSISGTNNYECNKKGEPSDIEMSSNKNMEKEKCVQLVSKEEVSAMKMLPDSVISQTLTGNIQTVTPTNVKSRMLPVVYIQAPTNLKSTVSSSTNVMPHQQILVNTTSQFHISALNTKLNIATKANSAISSALLGQTVNSKAQPLLLQKPVNTTGQTLIPVSLATSTGTKQTFAYIGTVIKQPNMTKNLENQIVLPTNHLPAGLVPAPTNQKILLAPMSMPKLTSRHSVTIPTSSSNQPKLANLILPMALSSQLKNSNQSVVNFKISNGQIQSDSKSGLTVLRDNKSIDNSKNKSNEKDLKQFDKEMIETTVKYDRNSDKPLCDKSYELSITEDSTNKCDISYTISIPEDGTILNAEVKDVFKTIKDDNKRTSVLIAPKPEIHRKPVHEISILRKSNYDKKSDISRNKLVEIKPADSSNDSKVEQADNNIKKEVKGEMKPEIRKVNTERRRKSQYTYLKDCDEVVVTSGNAWEEKPVPNDKFKNFQSSEITFTALPSAEEDTKELDVKKPIKDVVEIEVVKQELPQLNVEDDHDIRTALEWKDGIGTLPGSKLRFHINEFGFIEMLIKDEYEKILAIKKEVETKKDMEQLKQLGNDEILCCKECHCYGMPSEFINKNYCSMACKNNGAKTTENHRKGIFLRDAKLRKIKQKKIALMEKRQKDGDCQVKSNDDMNLHINITTQSDDDTSNDAAQDNKTNYPWQGGKKGFSWAKYLDHVKAKAAPTKLFKDPFPYGKNGFRPGMKLEGIDPQHPSYFCVMTVAEVQGYRVRLHFDGYPDCYDFWINADSMNIFPSGWCEKYNHTLHPPPNCNPSDFNWMTYLKTSKGSMAPRHLFTNKAGNAICPNGFRLGMKLEAVDKKNTSLICVATVTDVMDNRFLVHFDSWDDIYDYWADPSSPYIHPVGWCDQYGHNLTPPNDYPNLDTFTWDKYLKETKSTAAPVRAFKQRPSNGFRPEMRLECVDKRVPQLIRVATIDEVRDHQIRIRFDGWPDKYSYWVDDDSPDIHPAGWCQKTGHPLESPLTPEDVYDSFDCPTVGCRGIGHIRGSEFSNHMSAKDCPYADEYLDSDYSLPDRITVHNIDIKHEAIVPVSREPREKSKNKLGRPPKIRRLLETEIKTEWPLDDDQMSDVSAKKRKLSSPSESTSPPVYPNKKVSEDINSRFKTLVHMDFNPSPSQQVLAKHSKHLSEVIGTKTHDPRIWNQDEVYEFVCTLPSCKEHANLFIHHKIDGEAFLMLTQKDLVDILKFKLGPAIKLYNSIVLLRQNVYNFYND